MTFFEKRRKVTHLTSLALSEVPYCLYCVEGSQKNNLLYNFRLLPSFSFQQLFGKGLGYHHVSLVPFLFLKLARLFLDVTELV